MYSGTGPGARTVVRAKGTDWRLILFRLPPGPPLTTDTVGTGHGL